MLPARDPPQNESYLQTKSKGLFHASWKGKKDRAAILIPNKIDFKTKTIVRDKGKDYIMKKGAIQQEDITRVNIYSPNTGAPKYIKQILMNIKWEINSNKVLVRDFNTTWTSVDIFSKQKINEETVALNDTLDQMDLVDVFRALHSKAAECTFFSSANETFPKIDHVRIQNNFQ